MKRTQPPAKVLQCIRQGLIGGGESHLLSLLENIDRQRFAPTVLSFTDGPMIDRVQALHFPAKVIPSQKAFDWRKWRQVRQWMQQEAFSLVHVHGTRAYTNIYWAARSLGIPVVYTIHGWSFHDDQAWLVKKARLLSEGFLTAKAAVNISVSRSNKETGLKYFPAFQSIVINNGIDRSRFNPQKAHNHPRESLNIPGDAQVALFVGRFTHQKQPLVLLQAFAEAAEHNPKLFLLMAGDGDQKKEALEKIKTLSCKDRILLLPARQDVPDLLHAADYFILPSLWEGLPIALLEAMAMGKAVIATKVDGTRELIQHKQNGFLIGTVNLQQDLKNALLRLSGDAALCSRMSNAAQQTVAMDFCATAMTRRIEHVYEQIVAPSKSSLPASTILKAATDHSVA